jgi:hypothetical protein
VALIAVFVWHIFAKGTGVPVAGARTITNLSAFGLVKLKIVNYF